VRHHVAGKVSEVAGNPTRPSIIMQEALASKPVEERFEVELSTLYDRWRGNCRAAPLMTDRTSLTIRIYRLVSPMAKMPLDNFFPAGTVTT
jgi:hypothetical protein